MIIPPSNIQELYQRLLTDTSVPKKLHFHYKKWFRYYWDFCHQYKKNCKWPELKKNQNKYQIQQAVGAISILTNS